MSKLSFDSVSHAELSSVSVLLAPGMHVVLGREQDGTNTLLQLAAGNAPPRAGRITLNGVAPSSSALARRSTASLCAEEALPPARTVAHALQLVLRARADARSVTSVLGSAGLMRLALRRCADVSPRETRAVALALALSHPKPTLLALHEPLALSELVRESFMLEALSTLAESGVIVLVSASRVQDAERLGGTLHVLERGLWLNSARIPAPEPLTLRVQSSQAARLATLLSEVPGVEGVTWAGTQELLIRGSDLERLAQAVVKEARAASIPIAALRREPPALEALAVARANAAQAAPTQEPQ